MTTDFEKYFTKNHQKTSIKDSIAILSSEHAKIFFFVAGTSGTFFLFKQSVPRL